MPMRAVVGFSHVIVVVVYSGGDCGCGCGGSRVWL